MAATRQPTPQILPPQPLDVILGGKVDDASLTRAQLRYDYSQIDADARGAVQDAAVAMMQAGKRMQESRLTVGKRLIEVKALLPHGQFEDWCSVEFGLSQSTAQNMMNAAREFDGKSPIFGLLSDSAMYMLSGPSVPEAARVEIITQAQTTGIKPKIAEVKATIAKHKPAASPNMPWHTSVTKASDIPAAGGGTDNRTYAANAALGSSPPAAPVSQATMPPELVARGWDLRQLSTGRWWCNNANGPRATGVHDRAEDAIAEARTMQIDMRVADVKAIKPQADPDGDIPADALNLSDYGVDAAWLEATESLLYALATRLRATSINLNLDFPNGKARYWLRMHRVVRSPSDAEASDQTATSLEIAVRNTLGRVPA